MSDFEEKSQRKRTFVYDPHRKQAPDPMAGRKGERLEMYLGEVLGPQVLGEIQVWSSVLMAIKDGIPKPYDNSIIMDKIMKLERRTGEDFSELKKCCPPSSEVREAKELKPFIFAILDRIVEVGGLKNYVRRYEQD